MPVVTTTMPCRFQLYRDADPTGVSGTGLVAWGTVYPNGKVSLAWCGDHPSINVYESLADVEAVHGHDGATRIILCDEWNGASRAGLAGQLPWHSDGDSFPSYVW